MLYKTVWLTGMNPDLDRLHPYPFEKLAALKANCQPPADKKHIPLSIGEPQHAPPKAVLDKLSQSIDSVARYPATRGLPELRQSIAKWATRRFALAENQLDPDRHILPVAGTREALFAIAQVIVDNTDQNSRPVVMMPNPFYQIYEGAALLAGAEPYYYPILAENHFLPDFDAIPEDIWQRAQLVFVCSPGNPAGSVMNSARWRALFAKADQHQVVIAADECYSEIYFNDDQPPTGVLQAAVDAGRDDFRNIIAFHSLSKRSNLPGLRSGFVAGDAQIMQRFLRYRTYQGCTLPIYTQQASITAWADEQHVAENRRYYREKFARVLDKLAPVMDVRLPDAGFYLWANVGGDERDFARKLYEQQNVTVLPGQFLSRSVGPTDPGVGFVRMALVAQLDDCLEAADRICALLRG